MFESYLVVKEDQNCVFQYFEKSMDSTEFKSRTLRRNTNTITQHMNTFLSLLTITELRLYFRNYKGRTNFESVAKNKCASEYVITDLGLILDKPGFDLSCKLIGLAQHQKNLDIHSLELFIPIFEGVQIPDNVIPVDVPISVEEISNYSKMFNSSNPVNARLDSSICKSIFVRSGLKALVDVDKKNSLNEKEFVCAMIIISRLLDGSLKQVPTVLPISLKNLPSAQTQVKGIIPIVPPPDRMKYESFFNKLDKDNVGVIKGDEVVEFMKQSKLPSSTLASIW
ncbi:hypothetical protein O9G_001261 [Rozella allomycis CSF55]|uniref:EF-hand domain-containing protein n=1 Tax=Rozella allomycis (strain CSF55) TaxID=988480 RepID=A0A075ATK7_ROZAC|nr:hypothetical protein O9G_001261 [Rozella allomycis CSF55]|eukprot:EPZ33510.1 hypothetical protein O9G_001261 [Rozella allomycis CSF55]